MATKIQLRGISRTPSDKMSAEGGLAESLNFRIDNGESTPMVPATDLTSQSGTFASIGLPPVSANLAYNVLYLHKQNNYRNFICSQVVSNQTKVGIWTNPSTDTYTLDAFLTLPQGESIKEVLGVGNTLVIYTDVTSYYVLYKNEQYELLGSKIPSPAVRLFGYGAGYSRSELMSKCHSIHDMGESYNYTEGWYIKMLREDLTYQMTADAVKRDVSAATIKTKYTSIVGATTDFITAPVFMRTAVRLNDGFVNQSAPYCIGAGQNYSTDIFVYEWEHEDEEENPLWSYFLIMRMNPSSPKIKLYNKAEMEKWSDIILSIDVFATDMVENPKIKTGDETTAVDHLNAWEGGHGWDVIMDGQYESLSEIEELATSQNVFWKVLTATKSESIYDEDYGTTWDAMSTGDDGVVIPYPKSGEVLHLRDTLPDDYDSNNVTIAENAIVFNRRLVLSGVRQGLSTGNTWMGASGLSSNMYGTQSAVRLKYYVTANSTDSLDRMAGGDSSSVIGKDAEGNTTFTPAVIGTHYNELFCGWAAYPHPNCKKLILNNGSAYKEIEMKQHPKLSCSYAFFGFGERISDHGTVISGMTQDDFDNANPYLSYLNKMFYSEANNPFSFPVAYRQTFDSDVITCRVANKPLSQGETGKFPLYVFTKGGIYTMETTSLGTFNPPVNVSRDVALNARSVKSIDQAVIFTTAKGVMLISGGDISCLSTEMVGKRYVLETEAQTILNADENAWKKYLPILTDTTAFMDFMGNALYAYDYAGGRLICFNASKPYAYVYSLSSSTWHTLALPENLIVRNVLNTYPETYAAFDTDIIYWKIDPISDATKRQSVSQAIYYDCELGYSEEEISAMLETSGITIDEDLIDDEDDLENALTVAGASYSIQNAAHVFDYSTYLDVESDTANSGVIVTRPFDLGAPDVRKVIKDLRIRGRFNKVDVKYLLFGSMDGIKFGRLSSLHGASCKMYRLILLTSLAQAEKISYIEVEFENRFTNKLR